MPTRTPPPAARRHYSLSALLAKRAVREAKRAKRQRGLPAAAIVVATHQITSAHESETAVGQILDQVGFAPRPESRLVLPAFTTEPAAFVRMASATDTDFEFERLVASLVQEAGNAAEQVASAVRPGVGWTRLLTPPSCSRCVVLVGRVYRWSDGFLRHPGDDCVTIPVAEGDKTYTADPLELLRKGQIHGLSKADEQALRDGADFGRVVNVRSKKAGLSEAGTVLTRAGRLTPAGIYRQAGDDRAEALRLLAANGYIR